VSILYISHKLKEIKALCDEATILRNGKRIATAIPQQETAESLAALMMGETVSKAQREPRKVGSASQFALHDASLVAADAFAVSLKRISLELHAGEIVGIAGVAGNGQDELMQLISGERLSANHQSIELLGQAAGKFTPGKRRELGLCCVPEERLGHASVPAMSLAENAFLTAHHRTPMSWAGLVRGGVSKHFANAVIDQYKVQSTGSDATASSLSGGNLQKFIVGREIMQAPDVLVVSQPTWGVDAGAAAAIHAALQSLAAQGASVLIISQDLDELMSITDRIAALCAGRLSALHTTSALNIADVGLLMGGESIDVTAQTKPLGVAT